MELPVAERDAFSVPDTLVLPVETINRELDGKLHLALRAVTRGWKVVVGGRSKINYFIPSLPPSIYVSKGVRVGNKHILRLMEEFGHVPVALDEESLIRPSDEALLMMLDEETFNRPKLLFAWGRSNADVWRRFCGYRGTPIAEIGNPRIDLIRPDFAGYFDEEVHSIRQGVGNFVLVSTNFSMVNHFIPEHIRFKTAEGVNIARADEIKSGLKEHKRRIFEAFIAAVPPMARAVAPLNLVIRPHPSENPAIWEAAAEGLANVKVIHEGPIGPWIMAASALVQNGCTSAVEAAVAGTPSLAFRPYVSESYEVELSNRVSYDCRTLEALVSALRSIPPEARLSPTQRDYLRNHIASIDGPFSCDRLLDALEENRHLLQLPAPPGGFARLASRLDHFRRYPLRDAIKRLRRLGRGMPYRAHKFPGLPEDTLRARIARLRFTRPELPPVKISQLADSIFVIEANPN